MVTARTWLVAAALLVACGGGDRPPPSPIGPASFALALDVGGRLEVAAGERSHVMLTVVNAGAERVSFSARGLPCWATLDGNVVTLAPTYLDVGSYDVIFTATAGTSSDSASLKVVVVPAAAPNRPPVLHLGMLQDALHPYSPLSADGCFGTPWIDVHLSDEDGDAARAELEVVRAGTPFSGVATHASRWVGPSEYAGLLEVTGLVPGEPYDVALRSIDVRGGTYGWRTMIAGLTCVPVGLEVPYLEVYAGETRTFTLGLHGISPGEPYTITAVGLPDVASLSGATLTITAPTGLSAVRTYLIDFTLQARGYSYTARQQWLYLRP